MKKKRVFKAEQKMEVLRQAEQNGMVATCRKYEINKNSYFKWRKDFMEADKRQLGGDVSREANREEVAVLKCQNDELKKERMSALIKNMQFKSS